MIKIIDYGLGNVLAFQNVYKRLNIEAGIARMPEELAGAEKLILPGVGAFDHAMVLLDSSGMRPILERLVMEQSVPVLGVCVGMQILANGSDEGAIPGLGWISGRVRHFKATGRRDLQIPHMGWNDVTPAAEAPLFRHFGGDARFYFLHSYYFECARSEDTVATASYGGEFCCAVRSKNVYGVQFHPEKSHHFGAQLLRNFAEL